MHVAKTIPIIQRSNIKRPKQWREMLHSCVLTLTKPTAFNTFANPANRPVYLQQSKVSKITEVTAKYGDMITLIKVSA